ncbi:MAG TPA: hypothetical protein VEP90_17730 [Methylomirabilota bacterium]|nr:hypothetical protein [Methylomirabilota bacterium]
MVSTKGGKGGKMPFGGKQAMPFGKKNDNDADDIKIKNKKNKKVSKGK